MVEKLKRAEKAEKAEEAEEAEAAEAAEKAEAAIDMRQSISTKSFKYFPVPDAEQVF